MRTIAIAFVLVVAACSSGPAPTVAPLASAPPTTLETSVPTSPPATESEPPAGFRFWNLAELGASMRYSEFLDLPTMSAGIYSLAAASTDTQSPHGEDEVYYVTHGEAALVTEGETISVSPGSIIYVRAGVDHRFDPITNDLQTVVLFSSTPTDESTMATAAFHLSALTSGTPTRNVWDLFLSTPTLRFGLYRLPQSVGGDDPLTHTFDEINFVVSGQGTFRVEDFDLEIGPGSVMFVPATQAHSFHSLEADLDVLIFWEGPG